MCDLVAERGEPTPEEIYELSDIQQGKALPSDRGEVSANEDVPGYTFRFNRRWNAAVAYAYNDEGERLEAYINGLLPHDLRRVHGGARA